MSEKGSKQSNEGSSIYTHVNERCKKEERSKQGHVPVGELSQVGCQAEQCLLRLHQVLLQEQTSTPVD